MVRVITSSAPLTSITTKCYRCVCRTRYSSSVSSLASIERTCVPGLQQLMADANFTGAAGEKFVIPSVTEEGITYCIIAGLGAKKGATIDIEGTGVQLVLS